MRAAVVSEDRTFEVRSVPDPELKPDQVLVRVDACGICGSDIHMRDSGMVWPGMVMGHEMGGTVEAIGQDCDTDLEAGDTVAVMPCRFCGTCRACAAGMPQLCSGLLPTSMGLGSRPGGLAEYVTVWPEQCFRLPGGVPAAVGALAEPLAVGFHGVVESRLSHGDHAVVMGGGSIGVMVAVGLRAHGIADFFVSEVTQERRDALETLGFEAVSPRDVLGRSDSPDAVFDCTGVGSVLQEAIGLVRPGGTVLLMGVVERPAEILPMTLVIKEVSVRGILAYGETYPDAVAALGDGRIETDVLSAHRAPLDATEECFRDLASAQAPPKILIEPWA